MVKSLQNLDLFFNFSFGDYIGVFEVMFFPQMIQFVTSFSPKRGALELITQSMVAKHAI